MGAVAVRIRRFDGGAGLRVDAADLITGTSHRSPRDQHLSGQVQHHGCGHTGTVRPPINTCPSQICGLLIHLLHQLWPAHKCSFGVATGCGLNADIGARMETWNGNPTPMSALTSPIGRRRAGQTTTRKTWNSTMGPGWMRPCPTKMLWLTQAYLGSPDSRRGVVTK